MGITFYGIGIFIAILFFALAGKLWISRNKEQLANFFLEWSSYHVACNRGWIDPNKDKYDKIALEYAIKHNKKQAWTIKDNK